VLDLYLASIDYDPKSEVTVSTPKFNERLRQVA